MFESTSPASLNMHPTAVLQGGASKAWRLKAPVITSSCLAGFAAVKCYSPVTAAPAKCVRTLDGLNMYGR
jgi:hypothetical protein